MANRQQNIVKEMDVLIRMKALEKCEKKGKEEAEKRGEKDYESENSWGWDDNDDKLKDDDYDDDDDDDENDVYDDDDEDDDDDKGDDDEEVEDVEGNDEDEEDEDVEEVDGNRKREKEGGDRGRKEYKLEDNEGMKEESKQHRTAMDGSNQWIDEFHRKRRKIEYGARTENVDVRGGCWYEGRGRCQWGVCDIRRRRVLCRHKHRTHAISFDITCGR